jgi:hypothetical protein
LASEGVVMEFAAAVVSRTDIHHGLSSFFKRIAVDVGVFHWTAAIAIGPKEKSDARRTDFVIFNDVTTQLVLRVLRSPLIGHHDSIRRAVVAKIRGFPIRVGGVLLHQRIFRAVQINVGTVVIISGVVADIAIGTGLKQ